MIRCCRHGLRFILLTGCLIAGQVASGGSAAASIAQPDVVSTNPANYTPHLVSDGVNGHPHADTVAQGGNTIFIGGTFHTVTNSAQTQNLVRNNLFSFDADTGVIDAFAPNVDGPVWALEVVGSSLYVGGGFKHVNGVARPALVKLNANTGAVDTAFHAPFSGGRVNELDYVDGRLLVGGSAGKKLLALDPTTGHDTGYLNLTVADQLPNSWGSVSIYSFAVTSAGDKLVATGNFQTVDGQDRARMFMVDLGPTAGTLADWYYASFEKRCSSTNPRRIAYLDGVDFSPDGSYFVVTATGQVPEFKSQIGEMVCDASARFNTAVTHPSRPVWINYTGGDSVWSTAITGAAVYVQGHFQWLDNPNGIGSQDGGGASRRRGVGAIDPDSGLALPWNGDKPAAMGGKDFLATSSGLWIVSDSFTFHGEYHHGIVFCPL
jgi:hypothetical protein